MIHTPMYMWDSLTYFTPGYVTRIAEGLQWADLKLYSLFILAEDITTGIGYLQLQIWQSVDVLNDNAMKKALLQKIINILNSLSIWIFPMFFENLQYSYNTKFCLPFSLSGTQFFSPVCPVLEHNMDYWVRSRKYICTMLKRVFRLSTDIGYICKGQTI